MLPVTLLQDIIANALASNRRSTYFWRECNIVHHVTLDDCSIAKFHILQYYN